MILESAPSRGADPPLRLQENLDCFDDWELMGLRSTGLVRPIGDGGTPIPSGWSVGSLAAAGIDAVTTVLRLAHLDVPTAEVGSVERGSDLRQRRGDRVGLLGISEQQGRILSSCRPAIRAGSDRRRGLPRVAQGQSHRVRPGATGEGDDLILQDLRRPAVHPLVGLGSHRLGTHDLAPAPEQEIRCPLLPGDAKLGTHADRRLGVLAADEDHLVRLVDLSADSLTPVVRIRRTLRATRHRETRTAGMRAKVFEELPVVLDVEADEGPDLAHATCPGGARPESAPASGGLTFEVSEREIHLNVQELLLWNQTVDDVPNLRAGVPSSSFPRLRWRSDSPKLLHAVHDGPRERRNARNLRSSPSSSAVRSSMAKAANLLRRPPRSAEGSRYPALSINAS